MVKLNALIATLYFSGIAISPPTIAAPMIAKFNDPRICSRTPEVRQAIERFFNLSCDRLTAHDLLKLTNMKVELAPQTSSLRANDFNGLSNLSRLTISGAGLKSIPQALFNELHALIELRFPHIAVKSLVRGQFEGLTSLKVLRFDDSNAVQIENGAMDLTTNKYGELEHIEKGAFDSLSQLQTLSLGHNHLKVLSEDVFEGLVSLKHLILRNNDISEVASGAFRSLKSTRYVDLRSNLLGRIQSGNFEGLVQGAKVALYYNSITDLEPDSLPSSSHLDIEWNFTSFSPLRLEVKRGAFRGATFRHLELVNFREVNRLTEVQLEDGAFEGIRGVRELLLPTSLAQQTITANQLSGIRQLEALKIGVTGSLQYEKPLAQIAENAFQATPNLIDLEILGEFSNISPRTFSDLHHLKCLRLAGPGLNSYGPDFFKPFDQLEEVQVDDALGVEVSSSIEQVFTSRGMKCYKNVTGGIRCFFTDQFDNRKNTVCDSYFSVPPGPF